MPMKPELERLLRKDPRIWRGGRGGSSAQQTLPTGHGPLDEILPGGGWPVGALTEIAVPRWGLGELRLLLPALSTMAQAQRWLVFAAPPYHPYAPALAQAGIDLRYALLLDLESAHPDLFWSLEKLLRHPDAGVVMAWPKKAATGPLRRLQLAAEVGRSLGFLFCEQMAGSSPAALRLQLQAAPEGVEVRLLKARGMLGRQSVVLPL